jgi:hypothetical protein
MTPPSSSRDAGLRLALRVTGNTAFVLLAVALAGSTVLPLTARRCLWRAFLTTHGSHGAILLAVARRNRGAGKAFAPVSKIGGAVGYATIAALAVAGIVPGRPTSEGWRRRLQRAGHNVLLGLHAFTIAHGYMGKGRRARIYGPLAALWVAAATGMGLAWRDRATPSSTSL